MFYVAAQRVITGFSFGSASTHDQHLLANLFAARHTPGLRLLNADLSAHGSEVADKGFAGERPRRQWSALKQVDLVTPPHQTNKRHHWPKSPASLVSQLATVVETINDKLLNTFRLARERPHDLMGSQDRLVAKVTMHNFCTWFNLQLDRVPVAFAELLVW